MSAGSLVAEIFTGAVALGAFWLSCLGPPHLAVWPLRAFAIALGLTLAGAML